jgi:cell division septal protein FtsQ
MDRGHMSDLDTLTADLKKIEEEIEVLSEVRKIEIKRRYMVLKETILSLYTVEKRQEQFIESARKAEKTWRINTFIAIAIILFQLWTMDESNKAVTYIIVLGISLASVGIKVMSDISTESKSNQFWFEINHLKTEISSLTHWSTTLTREMIEIQNKYAEDNPNYEQLSLQKLQWEINAKNALIKST